MTESEIRLSVLFVCMGNICRLPTAEGFFRQHLAGSDLAESIRMHPDQQTLRDMMQQAGFENCDYHNLTGGIVAIHRGYKY